eukprot:COSAG04_NODE_1011_length_8770_cov_3.106677_2_plen_672_part_00
MMMIIRAAPLWLAAVGVTGGSSSRPKCRCKPGDACWPSQAEWSALNASLEGRLSAFVDELAPCTSDAASEECSATLHAADEYYVADQPNGLQTTGQFGAWNISTDHSAYTVRAETEDDFRFAVGFAHKHNLRLAVKNTGHDWYGRSTAAGSLMIWTHNRKQMTWHDSYTAPGCSDDTAVPAATIESGVQFIDLYPAAQKVGKLVIGGTCDTVGVAGCWLSGCYGVFSKKFGAGALNMLAARVVLANGTLVTASKCVNPDLFWSLRGGGGGNTGVVTEFVVRTHPAPKSVTGLSFSGSATTTQEYQLLFEAALKAYAGVTQDADQASNGGFGFGRSQTKPYSYSVSINLQGYESDLEKQRALLQPLADFVAAQPSGSNISGSIGGENTWTAADYDPTAIWGVGNGSLPWGGPTGPGGPSTLVDMQSKFIPLHYIESAAGRKKLASALIKVTEEIGGASFMTPKGQAGIPPIQRERFDETALNPVILDTAGTLLVMFSLPWVSQLPPSPAVLKSLWGQCRGTAVHPCKAGPRGLNASVDQYVGYDPDKAQRLRALCDAGVGGNTSAALACLHEWQYKLIPDFQKKVDRARETLWEALPNEKDGKPFSGAYWSETDYWERDFMHSYWGAEKYPKLLAVKDKYDPEGLFVCRHCVGSERWTEESEFNCRNETMWE